MFQELNYNDAKKKKKDRLFHLLYEASVTALFVTQKYICIFLPRHEELLDVVMQGGAGGNLCYILISKYHSTYLLTELSHF
jgi:hypothetical protein